MTPSFSMEGKPCPFQSQTSSGSSHNTCTTHTPTGERLEHFTPARKMRRDVRARPPRQQPTGYEPTPFSPNRLRTHVNLFNPETNRPFQPTHKSFSPTHKQIVLGNPQTKPRSHWTHSLCLALTPVPFFAKVLQQILPIPSLPWRTPRGKWMVSLVNSLTNATSKRWHLWNIDDLRFAPIPTSGGIRSITSFVSSLTSTSFSPTHKQTGNPTHCRVHRNWSP